MTKHLYKGQEVEVIQQFTTHWNVYYQEPMEHGGTRKVIVSCQPGQDLQLIEDNVVVAIADKPDVSNQEFNINLASFTSIRAHLPGIGRVAPKTVINNRPQSGYKDFEHFCKLNKKLNLNWDELKPILLFESPHQI